ncbi:DUF4123 domain-containing protein [Paraburkholderia tropica]|uniref:DUF4123 domain-containing protein n=1 Tax=Paraburkholderia tropica TaxID=92647 RepID=UPI002AB0BAE0|nr:DUF4123 domain-containing protein [Paraburkholderia tropica]
MTTTRTQADVVVPGMLDADRPSLDFPSAQYQYLLLHTRTIEDWAYRPSPPDSSELSAIAPSVVELVRAISPLARRRWLWEGMSPQPERGPLLVEITNDAPLVEHAKAEWALSNGVLLIGAAGGMDELHRHLSSLTRLTMPDGGEALFAFKPDELSAWLGALTVEDRRAWLGPMTQLLWRESRGPSSRWFRLEQAASGTTQVHLGWFSLRSSELSAFEHQVRENFIAGVANELLTVPGYSTLSSEHALMQVRKTLEQLVERNFWADEHFRDCLLLLARYPALQTDSAAHAVLNDLNEPPSARVRALEALVNEKVRQP